MEVKIDESWKRELEGEFEQDYFKRLADFVRNAYRSGIVYPPAKLIFHAFDRTPFDRTKVVIIGQDPYHEPNQAQGLCFYVPPSVKSPPSLLNIAKELKNEYPERADGVPNLLNWADQGVFLLNATLTVAEGVAGSHQGRGWETFTDAVIRRLAERRENLVFMLWGSYAQKKGAFIDRKRHLVLESAHPSPLSAYRGFFGNGHFKSTNEYLAAHGEDPINW